jgi:O-antigen ligase
VNDRLARLEQELAELKAENRRLRGDLDHLRDEVIAHMTAQLTVEAAASDAAVRTRLKGRWWYIILTTAVIVLPVVLLTILHANAFWSTVIGALNAIFVYMIGPAAVRLLAEGLIRAIPGVLLGQTARITLDKVRRKRAR